MFSLKAPSLLAFDQERTEGNLQRVYGLQRVPCETAMRAILDLVQPKALRPLFQAICRALQRVYTRLEAGGDQPREQTDDVDAVLRGVK